MVETDLVRSLFRTTLSQLSDLSLDSSIHKNQSFYTFSWHISVQEICFYSACYGAPLWHKNSDFCECCCPVINHSIDSKWSRNSDRTRSVSTTSYRILIRKIIWFCKNKYFSKKQIAFISHRFAQKLIFLEGPKLSALIYASLGGSRWPLLSPQKR